MSPTVYYLKMSLTVYYLNMSPTVNYLNMSLTVYYLNMSLTVYYLNMFLTVYYLNMSLTVKYLNMSLTGSYPFSIVPPITVELLKLFPILFSSINYCASVQSCISENRLFIFHVAGACLILNL